MTDPSARFQQAVDESKTLSQKPDSMTLLMLYGLYKQATLGDVAGERPGLSDFIARAKWDAWHEVKGKGRDEAMEAYVARIESLK